jgi:hypothetical protein
LAVGEGGVRVAIDREPRVGRAGGHSAMISVISPPELAEALESCRDARAWCHAAACEYAGRPTNRGGEWNRYR